MSGRELVGPGYDRIAERYLATKRADDPLLFGLLFGLLEALVRDVPTGGAVLDLGCGAGVPATRWLAERFDVTGVELSARQIELAREHVPCARLIQADMTEVELPEGAFDAAVALYAIIHVPRERQPVLLERIHGWLRPGGRFLATWALEAWEGEDVDWEGWGTPMWWSHYDAETSLAVLRETGFVIESAEEREAGGERWLWVLARRSDHRPEGYDRN